MTETFTDLVATYEQTCFACPTQYQGQLRDGTWFYFRYRYGTASLSFDGGHSVSLGRGDEFAGVMSEAEFQTTFVELYELWHRQAARVNEPLNLERLQALAAVLAPKEPFPARLEAGPVALERIKAVASSRESQPQDWVSELTGVPIVINHALEPDRWRLVDSNGQEMTAGRFR